MRIRKYRAADRHAVEHIQFSTWFLGKSGALIATDPKRFHKSIAYYLEEEPQSCFVAEESGKVVGYLLGCLDDRKHPEAISDYLLESCALLIQLPFMPAKDRKHWWGTIKMIFAAATGRSQDAKFKVPKDAGHLHINLLPEVRGKGAGSRLLKAFFVYAKKKGVKAIHADSWQTRLNPNKHFWLKNGFTEYSKVKTNFWKTHYPREDIRLVCYVKRF